MNKLIAVVMVGCLAASTSWGKSFSIDLRRPVARNGVRAMAQVMAPAVAENTDFIRKVNLDAGSADVGVVEVGDELAFTLFDDVAITLILKEQMPSPLGGDVFLAEASGYDGVKNAVVIRTEDGLTVDIQDYHKGIVYKVISSATGVMVQEIAPTTDKKCGCDTRAAPSLPTSEMNSGESPYSAALKVKSVSGNPDALTVDILVAYDTTAAKWAKENGGGLQKFAETAVQKMNAAIYNSLGGEWYVSKYLFVFRLVGVYEIGGPGFVAGDDPDEACDKALDAAKDGTYLHGVSWAGVADKRDEVGADIVVTLIDIGTASGTVGIGYSFEATSSGFSSYAYNCCAIRAVHESHTMTHECGHNMGAGHATAVNPQEIDPGPQFYSYSAGYYFKAASTNCHTIMAYNFDGFGNHYKEVPYFSSPDVTYAGVKVGDSSHNNALTLQNNYAVVAAFRKSKEEMEEEPPEEDPPVAVGQFSGFTWRTCERFPWQVYTNWYGEVYMYSGDFRVEGSTPLTGESWIETTVTGPSRLGFYYNTYMMEGPFKVAVDGATQFSTRSSGNEWVDVDIPAGEHTVRFTFVCNGWYCSDDTYNGVNVYDVRLYTLDYRPVIVPESTDNETTATRFSAPLEVVITNGVPGSVIYYTMDDSEPTMASKVYAGAFTITNSTVIKAIARQGDGSLTMPVTGLLLERHPVQPGEWTADADGAISAAAKNGNLIIVQYTESEGGVCRSSYKKYADITESVTFTDWAKHHGVYLVACDVGMGGIVDTFSIRYRDTYEGRSRYLEYYSAYKYYDKVQEGGPAICIARAWLPYEAIGMSSLENGSYVGGVRYDGTAATLIKGLETYLQSEQRPQDGSEVTVSFDVRGGAMEQTNRLYKSGQPFGVLPVPELRLYRFDGWMWNNNDASKRLSGLSGAVSEDELVPYADVNLYAKWVRNAVYVVFDWHYYEETWPEYRSYDYRTQGYTADGTYDFFPDEWTRTGYQFAGWFDAPVGGSRISVGDSIPANATDYSVTNHAHWTANTYKVVFHSNATYEFPVVGEMADQNFVYDMAQGLLANRFSRQGYEFQGWSVYSNSYYAAYLDGEVVSNLTYEANGVKDLYAVWQSKGYVVRFNANGDSDYPVTETMQKQFFDMGEEKPLAKNRFEREGFDFGGWATYPESVVAQYEDEQVVKNMRSYDGAVIDLYAFWVPKKVTVTFRDDREPHKKYTVNEYTVGTVFHNVPWHVSTEAGFEGWFSSAGERIQLGKTRVPSRDTTYYARWTEHGQGGGTQPGQDEDVCKVTFDANGGEISTDESVRLVLSGSVVGELPDLVRVKYTFVGWFTERDAGDKVSADTVVANDVTFYAHWVVDSTVVKGIVVTGPAMIDLYDCPGGQYVATVTCSDGTTAGVEPEWSVEGVGVNYAQMSRGGELSFYYDTYTVYQCATATVTAAYGGFTNTMQTVLYGPGYVTIDKYEVSLNAIWPGCTYTVTPKSVRWWRHGVLEEPTSDLSDVAFTWSLSCPGDEYRSGGGSSFTVPLDAFSTNGTCTVYVHSKPDRERYYQSSSKRFTLQFYASCPQMVTVMFDANGGEASFTSLNCVAGKPYGSEFLPTLTRKGYAGYWYTAREGGSQVTYSDNAPVVNTTLYAQWSPRYYYLKFDANGGEGEMYTQYLYYDTPATIRERTFKREGYSFLGWALSPDGPVVYQDGEEVLNLRDSYGVISLYAKWKEVGCATVVFFPNEGNGTMDAQTFTIGEEQPLSQNAFSRDGYSFEGWATSPDGAVVYLDEQDIAVSTDVSLYAVWKATFGVLAYASPWTAKDAALKEGKLLFVLSGADWCGFCTIVKEYLIGLGDSFWDKFVVYYCNIDTDTYGMANGSPAYGVFDPKQFNCNWSTGRLSYNSGGVEQRVQAVIDEALANYHPTTYTVTFDVNCANVTAPSARTLADGAVVGDLPPLTRDGYTFDGWWTAKSGGRKVTESTEVTASVTYYAHWTKNSTPDPTPDPTPEPGPDPDPMPDPDPDPDPTPDPGPDPDPTPDPGPDPDPTPEPGPDPDPTPDPTPEPTPAPYPEQEEIHELNDGEVDGAAPTTVASEYNGYLYDEKSGEVRGTIQVKVGKPGKKDGAASVKATVIIGTKKVTLKAANKGKAAISPDGPTEIELVGGEACEIVLGEEGLSGFYGAYFIDGARNFFASKDKGEVSAANAILAKWLGSFMVICDGGSLSVSIAAKGKVKVSGTLADGKTKVSVSTVLLIGEEWSCVSVAAQKANLAFVLWLSHDGKTIEAEGLGDNVLVGLPGTLANGATFQIDPDEFAAVFGQAMLPYLPDGVPVSQKGTKWTLPKAGKVVYKNGAVDESKLGENPCGLKLTYKAKEGTFKGSFKVYAEVKGKPKATTVNVTGFLLGGVGYGEATIKGKGSVAVIIE